MRVVPLVVVLAVALSTGVSGRIVCYYANWSRYGSEPFMIESIEARLCSHIVYAFMGLDENGYLTSNDPWNDFGDDWSEGGLKRFLKLRKINPGVRLMVGVGGWNQGPANFQKVVRSPEKRRTFLTSSIDFIRHHDLDGMEIDWIYQDSWGGSPEDKAGFSELLGEMNPVYKQNGFNLSIATSANRRVFDNSYNISALARNVDYVNVMTYDLHGSWDRKTGHVAPLHAMKSEHPEDRLNNVEAIINRYIEKGAIPEKLLVGLAGYGRTFKLVSPGMSGMNEPTRGPGKVEPLPYRTFCREDNEGRWEKSRNDEQKVPYAVSGDEWVGYEDPQSLREKVKFAKWKKLGGVSFWTFDMDDYKGVCGRGKYPLLSAVNEEMSRN